MGVLMARCRRRTSQPIMRPFKSLLGLALGLAITLSPGQSLGDGVISKDGPSVVATGELAVGDTIPNFTLPLMGGGTIDYQSQLKGKVLIVNYWATWCAPCVEEIPALERLRRQLKGTDIEILTININEGDTSESKALLERSRAQLLTALDPGGKVALTWGTAKLPETYVIAPGGEVVEKIIGAQIWDRGDRVAALKALAPAQP